MNRDLWSGPEADRFAELLAQAAAADDPAKRAVLYAAAERLLGGEAAIVAPLFYGTSAAYIKPNVERTYARLAAKEEVWTWKVR